ncbi:increased rDNA silencing protein 4-like [Nicotiana tomentosiformis]|uniref:increased rDNA silencing protein 4-like n=1 Tax=Nicotiana tomentosiformis TaxID=4098 RepID=UPI00388C46E3
METQTAPSIVPTLSSPIETPMREPTIPKPSSPNPKLDSQPPTGSSPTQSSTGSHRSRKTSTPKKCMATTSPFASPKRMVEEDTTEGEENQEISSPLVEESNALPMSSEFTLDLQEQEAIENMLSIAVEGFVDSGYEGMSKTNESRGEGDCLLKEGRELVPVENLAPDITTAEPTKGPDTFTQEEPYAPTWDETPYSSKEPQVSTDPAPSPYFYAKPLAIVVPEMRYLSEGENDDSEEDYDNVDLASFISARNRRATPNTPTPKRPTTRLQQKEALESALKKSKKEKKRRRLVKGRKLVHEEVVPTALVVDIDDEVDEEPSPLIRKFSKKPAVQNSGIESSMKVMEVRNVEVNESREKVAEGSGKNVSEKPTEKRNSVKKSVKRKASVSEEPSSCKKAKVDES